MDPRGVVSWATTTDGKRRDAGEQIVMDGKVDDSINERKAKPDG